MTKRNHDDDSEKEDVKSPHSSTDSNLDPTFDVFDRIRSRIGTSSREEKQNETKLVLPTFCCSNSAVKNSISFQESNVSSTTSSKKKIKTENNTSDDVID